MFFLDKLHVSAAYDYLSLLMKVSNRLTSQEAHQIKQLLKDDLTSDVLQVSVESGCDVFCAMHNKGLGTFSVIFISLCVLR